MPEYAALTPNAVTADANGLVLLSELPVSPVSLCLAGSGAPASGTGLNGDTYEDTATGKRYTKSGGVWTGVTALPGWALLATTGTAGYTMTLAGSTILTWTAPADGLMHRVSVMGEMIVTTTFAGASAVNLNFTDPGGTARVSTVFGSGQTAGTSPVSINNNANSALVQAGSTVTVSQGVSSAGAAIMWLEIWGS